MQYRYDEDGMLVISARLPSEIGEVVRRAIDSAMELLYRDGMRKKRRKAEGGDALDSAEGERYCEHCDDGAGGLGDAVAPVVATLDDAGDVKVTFEAARDVPAGTPEAESDKAAGAVDSREPEHGTSSAARKQSNVPAGTRTADVPAKTPTSGAETEDSPPVPGFHETPGGQAVVEEFEGQEWSESLGARRADALRLLAESYLAGGWRQLAGDTPINMSADRYQVVVHVDHALLAGDRHGSPPAGPRMERCAIENGPALAIDTVRRLACESSLVGVVDDEKGEPLDVGRKTRAISPALARALRARDGGCRFPSCDRTLGLHAHHVVHWVDGGETKLSNLQSACTYHHVLLHEGGFDVKATGDNGFVFYDPTGKPLPEAGRLSQHTLDELARAAAERRVTVKEQNRALGLGISAEASACRWAGERMDYGIAVDGLVRHRDRARQRASIRSC